MNSRIVVSFGLPFLLFFLVIASRGYADTDDVIFTSPRKIRTLLQTQDHVVEVIDEYIASERKRLQEIQEYIETWKRAHEARAADKYKYLANPFNTYRLMKTFTLDWQHINEKMQQNNATEYIKKFRSKDGLIWPNMKDYEGVQDSLLNIQLINGYRGIDLSNGKIGDLSTDVILTFDECVALMKKSEGNLNYNLTQEWASAAIHKFFTTPFADEKRLVDIIYSSIIAGIMEGNFETAEYYLNLYSMLKPVTLEIKNLQNFVKAKSANPSPYVTRMKEKFDNMTRLCSTPSPVLYDQNLRCRYNFKNTPFLRIAPLKEEIVSLHPRIILFREVLYDSEIDRFKEEGERQMFAAAKTKENESNQQELDDRLNDIAFFKDDEFKEVITVTQRTHDMTRLQRNVAQPWQITNYGIGGYFYEHSDIKMASQQEIEESGRRVVTISFILSNADVGGSTIFPQIDMKVDPNQGDALVWFNLLKDGTEDIRVRHGACPVLVGHKWELIRRINETKIPK